MTGFSQRAASLARRHPWIADALCIPLISAVCLVAGLGALSDWRGPAYTLTNELYVPAAMFAWGEGFINPPLEEVPGLREFLYPTTGTEVFTLQEGGREYSRTEWDTYQRYHRYLIYLMGVCWKLFGTSWEGAKAAALVLYTVSALIIYAMVRMACGCWLGLGVALLVAVSPVNTGLIFNIRDYSKSPFLLAVIGLLLYLLVRQRRYGAMLRAAALLGLAAGLGLGFRRDLMIAIPPIVAVLALAPIREGGAQVAGRAVAMAVFGVVCVFAASPVLSAFNERGTLAWHDTMMGFADVLEDDLGIRDASYERMPVKHDNYVSGVAASLARQEQGGDGEIVSHPDDEKRGYVLKTVWLYPADMLLRAYAAVAKILRGVFTYGPGWFHYLANYLEHWGCVHAVLGLTAIAALRPRLGVACMLLLLYFGGITSLQFEWRHAVHLYFVPVFFLLFPVWLVVEGVRARRGGGIGISGPRAVMRASGFLVGTTAFLLVPWGVAAAWQVAAMHGVEGQLSEARTTPISTERVEFEGWVYFKPSGDFRPRPDRAHEEEPHFTGLYLMAELESYAGNTPLEIVVQSDAGGKDFSTVVYGSPVKDAAGLRVRYFFNVPEERGMLSWDRFEAVGLPAEHAGAFKGLHLVNASGAIGTNVNYALVDAEGGMRRLQWLEAPIGRSTRAGMEVEKMPALRQGMQGFHEKIRQGAHDAALVAIDGALGWGLCRLEMLMARALVHREKGDLAGEWRALLDALRESPYDSVAPVAMDQWIWRNGREAEALALWSEAAEMAPGNLYVTSRVERAQEMVRSQNR